MKQKDTILELRNITKKFDNITANENISIKIKRGSIHVVAGENGAGKSVLMKMLFGRIQPTSGQILLNGEEIKLKNSKHANDLKIGMVHQHFKLINIFTGLENIILGNEPTKGKFIIDKKAAKKMIEKSMQEFNLHVEIDVPVENLTVGQKQKLEIIKLLYKQSEILILDEPTAVLTPQEITNLIKTIKEFKNKGKTIIVITHKLNEIQELADDITVLRHGKVVDKFTKKQLTATRLTRAIVGKKISKIKKNVVKVGKIILETKKINIDKIGFKKIPALTDVSLKVREGEIVAIAGVEGNGQKELALAVTGMLSVKSGQIIFRGKDVTKDGAQSRYRMGMSHIPEDRQFHGILMNMPLIDSAAIQDLDIAPYSKGININRKAFVSKAKDIVKKYDVRGASNLETFSKNLYGGNQQKFIVGREITRKGTKMLMITQPTRGLDVGSIEYIHKQIQKAKKNMQAILLISCELSEVITLADKVLVLSSGKIVCELVNAQITKNKIGKFLTSEGKGTNNA